MATDDVIDSTIAALDAALKGTWPRRARILAEARDHLLEAAEAAEACGKAPDEAAEEAVARFGAPSEVALAFARARANSTLNNALLAVGLFSVVMVLSWPLELLFPTAPVFRLADSSGPWRHWEAGAIAGVAVAAALLCWAWAWRHRPVLSMNVLSFAFALVVTCVAGLHAFGRHLQDLQQFGAGNTVPMLVRVALCLGPLPALLRLDLAVDSLKRIAR